MAERSRLPIPFGGGLDRYTGVTEAQPAAFSDLLNVHLRRGGMEVRGGLEASITIAGEDAILAAAPIRSLGIGALITWNSTTRKVSLYLVSGDGTTSSVGTVWTIPAGIDRPRVVTTDSYNLLFIAHDQPSMLQRQVTRVYKPATSTIVDLEADLYRPDGTTSDADKVAVAFRGVARHLNYLVGWGYGSEKAATDDDPADDDRAEIVRMSLPGQPLEWDPEHYFLAGQRGEAVASCQPSGKLLSVLKGDERYTISGYDRRTFGIFPTGELFGLAAQRLAISVAGVVYYWSHAGPRRCVGDNPSDDLALPLDLEGPDPSAAATAAVIDDGYAGYDPDRREVIFCFGTWAYVLHVGEPGALRWSYREYGVEVICSGLLQLSETTGIGPDALATFGAATETDYDTIGVTWDADITAGALVGTERIELWGKSAIAGSTWEKLDSKIVTGDGAPSLSSDVLPGVDYDLAVRLTLSGVPSAGYTDTDPTEWPAGAQGTITTGLPTPTLTAKWERLTSTTHQITITPSPLLTDAHVETKAQYSTDDGQTWTDITGSPQAYGTTQITFDSSALDLDSDISFQARYESTWDTGEYGQVDTIVGLAAPGVPTAVVTLFTECESQVDVTVPGSIDGGQVKVDISSVTHTADAPDGGGDATVSDQISCTDADTTAFRARNEVTVDGVTDVSAWVDGVNFELTCNPSVPC